ncbi:MAG: FliG C-terminal domain-containing protein [Pseudomonadota bacterium]
MPSDLPELPPLPTGGPVGSLAPSLPSVDLPRPDKAAIITQLLLKAGVPLALDTMPERLQKKLIERIGALAPVDADTVAAIADEFADALTNGPLAGGAGMAGALALVDGSASASLVQRLKAQAGDVVVTDAWEQLVEKEPHDLLPIFERESVEVSAVVLSKLAVGKAAAVLGLLPGPHARRITYAVSQIGAVRPDAVQRIGTALLQELETVRESAFAEDPVEKVGAILNSSRAATRNTVLEGLEESDPAFAEEVRRSIFTFGNIPARIDARDVPKIVREVDQEVLVRALAAAAGDMDEVAEFIFGAMSKRMADALRDEIMDLGEVDGEAGEDAMGTVVAAIRALEEAGELHLLAEEA